MSAKMQLLSLFLVPLLLSLSSVALPAFHWQRGEYDFVIHAESLINNPSTPDTFADQAVAQHNAARAKYGANPVTWNSAIYSNTLAYAKKCVFEHRSI